MKKSIVFLISIVYSIPFYFGTYETDWMTYREYLINYYKYSLNEFFVYTYRTEYGFDLFMYLFMCVFNNPSLFIFFNVFLTTLLLLLGLMKLLKISTKSDVIILCFSLFINYPFYELNSNIIRQNLALGLLMFFLSNKKKFILLSAFFHISTVLFSFGMLINKFIYKKWFVVFICSLLMYYRNIILKFSSQFLHNIYDTPNPLFVLVVLIASLGIRKSSRDLSNFGLFTFLIVVYFWPLSQFTNRFILFGHGVIIPFFFVIIKKLFYRVNV